MISLDSLSKRLIAKLGVFKELFQRNSNSDFLIKLKENEIMAAQTDWKDEHHMRFCEQTQIEKRFLPFKSAVNMRDIGGYIDNNNHQIKWNKIYRGEELCHLSEEDQEKFKALGINYIFDLRNSDKALLDPDPKFPGVENINIPVLEGLEKVCLDLSYPNFVDKLMRNIYVLLCEKRGNMFARILEVLYEEPDAKIYIHCTNGKDRTGFAIAMIMLLANCHIDEVISDYSLSNYHVNRAFKLFDNELVSILGDNTGRLLYGTIGVDPDWLNLQIDYINNKFAGIDDYLLRNTILRKYDLATIRENILEPVPDKKETEKKDK